MNTNKVLCLALVLMAAAPAFGGLLKDAMVLGALKTAADKHSETIATTAAVANPSAPLTTGDTKALLFGASVDLNIRKVPVVTMSDAPCKNICKNVCKVDMTKSCTKVPVITKECSPTKKTLTKQVCSKKCALTVETPKVVKSIKADTPSNPNPSTPAAVNAVAVSTASAHTQLPSLSISKELDITAAGVDAEMSMSAGKGRRLSGIAIVAAKATLAEKFIKSLPVPACSEVCEDVHFEVPDLECHEVTHEVETCKLVPTKNCQQECVCIPQKTFAVNLPKKTLGLSITKP